MEGQTFFGKFMVGCSRKGAKVQIMPREGGGVSQMDFPVI